MQIMHRNPSNFEALNYLSILKISTNMKKITIFTAVIILCLQGMIACRSDDILPKSSLNASSARTQWQYPHASQDSTAFGIFTFLNGQKAVMYFDEKGEITSLNIDGDGNLTYEYDSTNGYLEIIKWKIEAVLQEREQLKDYEFFKTPVIRWHADLNSAWSGVAFLDQSEQAKTEGTGTFVMTYLSSDKPAIDPIKPIRGLVLEKFIKPSKNTQTNF